MSMFDAHWESIEELQNSEEQYSFKNTSSIIY